MPVVNMLVSTLLPMFPCSRGFKCTDLYSYLIYIIKPITSLFALSMTVVSVFMIQLMNAAEGFHKGFYF